MRLHRVVWALIGSGILMGITALGAQAPAQATVPPAFSAAPGDVVINEVAWGGTAASTADEWIELYNNVAVSVSLGGWRLATADGMSLTLQGEIAPHGYYLIERTDDTTVNDIPADRIGPFGNGLNNTGETITLTNASGIAVDTANGNGGTWPAGTTTATMERIDSAAPDTPGNWATNTGNPRNGLDANNNPINGTPKRRNSVSAQATELVVGKSGPQSAQWGALLTYTLRCENFGNIAAAGAILTDTLPIDAVYITSTAPYPAIVDARTLRWDLGDLPISSGAPTVITLSVYAPTSGVGMITNTLTTASAITDATPALNVAHWTTLLSAIAPALDLTKTGPSLALPNTPLTYTLVVSNSGGMIAQNVRLTDTLPAGLVFVAQNAPYPFTQLDAATLVWEVGNLAPETSGHITLTLALGETTVPTLTNVATATAQTGETASAAWSMPVQPNVQLYAVQPGNYGGSGEAVALINLSTFTVDLRGWCIDDVVSSTSRACLPVGAQVAAGQTLWLAQNADGFYPIWGFDADWASASITRPVSLLTGSWPGFTDAGEVTYLINASGVPADVLVYGKDVLEAGWQGPAVPHPYAGYNDLGQVLYRKLDANTGLPVPDTDSARDWAQDPTDPFNGRKLRYPGWDLETLFFPVEVAETSAITLAVAPDGMLDFVLDAVTTAQKSLIIEGYTLGSVPLYEALDARIRAGVVVTILLDSAPVGGLSAQEKWGAQQLHNPPTSTVYFMGGSTSRYRYQHAKFVVIDGQRAIISTDNFGENSMPSDILENGTMGHRGLVLLTDSADVVARLNTLFHFDCDPVHHIDVFPYSDAYAPPESFVPLPPPDWTTYTVAFSPTLVTTASHLTLLHAPEHTLREEDALIGLLNGTLSGTVDVMQMNEPLVWTSDTGTVWLDAPGHNPRLAALVAAAQRGVTVRLLLDAYYDNPLSDNSNTATCLYLKSLHLPTLQCRLGNVAGLGIHAKIFLVDTGDAQWVHLGSINGTETSNKINREVAVQFASPAGYSYLRAVFENDWALSHGPMVHRIYLPLVMRDYVPPVTYPLITEIFINPDGEDAGKEWIEIYHPGYDTVNLNGWSIGDALNSGDYGDGRYAFPAGSQLLPKQVIVVAACATEFATRYGLNPTYEWINCDPLVPDMIPAGAWEGFGIALGNVTDEVLLLDAAAAIDDSAAWGGVPRAGVIPFPMEPDSTFPWNATLKRYPPEYDRNDCSRDFYISYQPSPGRVSGSE